jgi:hypothetical protein
MIVLSKHLDVNLLHVRGAFAYVNRLSSRCVVNTRFLGLNSRHRTSARFRDLVTDWYVPSVTRVHVKVCIQILECTAGSLGIQEIDDDNENEVKRGENLK